MGIGVDIAQLARFKDKSEKFIRRVLTDNEYAEYAALSGKRKQEYLAGRFCAKEAYYKAKKDASISYRDAEILTGERGEPILNNGEAFVSISHDGDAVVALVIIV